MFKEVDWLMNEEGSINKIDAIKTMVRKQVKLFTCIANWNGKDPVKITKEAFQNDIGLYGFTKPDSNSLKPDMKPY